MKYLTEANEVRRLVLQVERDLLKQSRLKTMLLAASVSVADHRQQLRTARERMTRAGRGKGKSAGRVRDE